MANTNLLEIKLSSEDFTVGTNMNDLLNKTKLICNLQYYDREREKERKTKRERERKRERKRALRLFNFDSQAHFGIIF